MLIDKNKFFKEIALRITSILDIKTALKQTFTYMKEYMPINQMYINTYHLRTNTLQFIASVTDGSKPLEPYITFPSDALYKLSQRMAGGFNNPKVRMPFILNPSSKDPQVQAVVSLLKLQGKSEIVNVLMLDGKSVGALILRANGENVFTPEHVELVAGLDKLFAIVLSNFLATENLRKKQNILINDNQFLIKENLAYTGDEVVGGSSGLREVLEMVREVASQKTTVLIAGETGTGKELIANAIHLASPRKNGPFIKLNCGAIADNLIDDELFGHEKGAFTGAIAEKRGRFERASGGTLFLDEIGELPLQSQVRLLRVLQNRVINRVGGEKTIPVDVRIIAGTHRDLKQMVSDGRFREDLWFRVNVFPIVVPPLRQRKDDIPDLARYFIIQKSREIGADSTPDIAPGALERLIKYNWPGNVRELENLIERELIRYKGGYLCFNSLLASDEDDLELSALEHAEEGEGTSNLDEVIAKHIKKILEQTKGKISGPGGAAERLGVIPTTLRGKMRKLGIVYRKKTSRLV